MRLGDQRNSPASYPSVKSQFADRISNVDIGSFVT